MPVIHIAKRDRWSPIANATLEDARLSFKARGLLAYLLSKPEQWTANITELCQASTHDGEKSIRAALAELVEHGYAEFTRIRVAGKFVEGGWIIREQPSADFRHVEKRHVEKRHAEKRHAENRHLSKDLEEVMTESSKDLEEVMTDITPPRKQRKRPMPSDESQQSHLRTTILDDNMRLWAHTHTPGVNLDHQWEYFVNQCLARGYEYADFRRAFQNSLQWENSPARRPLPQPGTAEPRLLRTKADIAAFRQKIAREEEAQHDTQ